MPQVARIAERAIRDTAARVFAAPEYNAFSPIERLWRWLADRAGELVDLITSLLSSDRPVPGLVWAVSAFIALLILALAARIVMTARARRGARAPAAGMIAGGRGRELVDPLAEAQAHAARGEFTEAAHALYRALLAAAARQEQIRLHPSKTVGDYARELRSRSSSMFAGFREFGRSYETVIYGLGACDRQRFERLYALASTMMQPRG